MFEKNDDASASLRLATELKNSGKLNEAVTELGKFQRLVASGKVAYPVACFLRLPMYLQVAGRRDEAWAEFYRLLKHGYPNRLNDAGVWLYEKSEIYGKMRLFLERDGNAFLAVHFAIMSYGHELAALSAQKRREDLAKCAAPENAALLLASLLRKAKRPDFQETGEQILAEFIRRRYDLDFLESESGRLFAGGQ